MTTELPQLRKKVVYLDQFAISNMAKTLNPLAKGHASAAANPLWLQLFDRVDRLKHLQLVVCPSSDEHDRESSFTPYRKDLRRMYEHLSAGNSFLPCERVRLLQVEVAARAWSGGNAPKYSFEPESVSRDALHEWNDRLRIEVDLTFPGEIVEGMRSERDAYHQTMSDHFKVIQANEPRTFTEWLNRELAGVPRGIRQAYVRWSERQHEIFHGHRAWTLNDAHPPEAVDWLQLVVQLCGGEKSTRKEALARALEFVDSRTFEEIPFSRVTCLVNAMTCVRATVGGQKTPPNRGADADLRIVSTLLPYCDAMFIDDGFRSLLKDIPKAHRLPYATHIFSTNTAEDFLAYLDTVEEAAPAEHVARVMDVYGESWLNPRRRLYDLDKKGDTPA